MALEQSWPVQFVGGPLDGGKEAYATTDGVPRLAIRAVTASSDGGEEPISLSSVAIYELSMDAARYHHIRSLPVAISMIDNSAQLLVQRRD